MLAYKYKEIQVDEAFTFTHTHYVNNIASTPTSPTAVVYDNEGNTVENITGSVSGTEMSFIFSASKNNSAGRNYKITITYQLGGVDTIISYLFDVVLTPVPVAVTDEDLFIRIKDLRDVARWEGQATATGTTTTMVDDNLGSRRITWVGGEMEILYTDQATDNIKVKITAYDGVNTLTFTPSALANIPDDTPYILRMSYQDQIDSAYYHVMTKVRNRVGLLAGYIDFNSINELIIYRALYMICISESDQEGDKWDYRARNFKAEFDNAFSNFNQGYDSDLDGNISDDEQNSAPSFGTISLQR